MEQKIRIFLCDNQDLFRESLIKLLQNNSRFETVAEASNGRETIDWIKKFEEDNIPIDVLLLDVEMPVMDGMTTLEIIEKRFPKIKVLILGASQFDNKVSAFVANGARGYLSKKCKSEKLLEAIEKVHVDGFYFDDSISLAMRETLLKNRSGKTAGNEMVFNYKEIMILKKVCMGLSNKQIALSHNMSASGVDFYKGKIYSKTECHNKVELIKYALKNDLISLSEL
jgi:DNA-binding NarL/FixJ family response regulator